MTSVGPLFSEAARLAADAHQLLFSSRLHLEASGGVILPDAENEIAKLLQMPGSYACELLRVSDAFGQAEVSCRLRLELVA